MITRKLNPAYSGGIPLNIGDRYYGQELIRDHEYAVDQANQALGDVTQPVNRKLIVSGGIVSQGVGDTLDITACVARAPFAIQVPQNFGAFPFPTVSEDQELARISLPAQTNYAIPSATLNGIAINYVKLAFAYTNANTRNRSDAGGSYSADVSRSFVLTVDTVAPTAYEVLLATVVGLTGGTFNINNFSPTIAAGIKNERHTPLAVALEAAHTLGYIKDSSFQYGWWRGSNSRIVTTLSLSNFAPTLVLRGVGANVDTYYEPGNKLPFFAVPYISGGKVHFLVRAGRSASFNGDLEFGVELFNKTGAPIGVTYTWTISNAQLSAVGLDWFSFAILTGSNVFGFNDRIFAKFRIRTTASATLGEAYVSKCQATDTFAVPFDIFQSLNPGGLGLLVPYGNDAYSINANVVLPAAAANTAFAIPLSEQFANQVLGVVYKASMNNGNTFEVFKRDPGGAANYWLLNHNQGMTFQMGGEIPVASYNALGQAQINYAKSAGGTVTITGLRLK